MKVLVSACLLGKPVRYDGQAKPLHHGVLEKLQVEGRVVSFCPECAGGLPTPRPAAEQVGDRVLGVEGQDFTLAFYLGAQLALEKCQAENIEVALLKERSPSCGSSFVYDGTFSGNKTAGMGVTAQLLSDNGIQVFSEEQMDAFSEYLNL